MRSRERRVKEGMVTYTLSEQTSSIFISFSARARRLNSGATVTAVTCPCQFVPVPSALPNTTTTIDIKGAARGEEERDNRGKEEGKI